MRKRKVLFVYDRFKKSRLISHILAKQLTAENYSWNFGCNVKLWKIASRTSSIKFGMINTNFSFSAYKHEWKERKTMEHTKERTVHFGSQWLMDSLLIYWAHLLYEHIIRGAATKLETSHQTVNFKKIFLFQQLQYQYGHSDMDHT